jgi:dihydroflavonol-4-reductase
MTNSKAAGERFLATSGESLWMVEIARLLKDRLGPIAGKVSTRELPNILIKTIALTNPAMKGILPLLGVRLDASGEKAKQLLGWNPRSPEEAILASAESLVRLGMVEPGVA